MDHLKGWKIDLKTAYGLKWNKKGELRPGVDFSLWESHDEKIACLLYNIKEIGISKEVGSLAIFSNKEMPELIYNFRYLECWYLYKSAIQFGKDGILFIHRFDIRGSLKFFVLNLTDRRFALIEQIPEDFYDVRHIEDLKYNIKNSSSNEKIINLKELKWRILDNRSDFYPDAPITNRVVRSALILMTIPFHLLITFLRKIVHNEKN